MNGPGFFSTHCNKENLISGLVVTGSQALSGVIGSFFAGNTASAGDIGAIAGACALGGLLLSPAIRWIITVKRMLDLSVIVD